MEVFVFRSNNAVNEAETNQLSACARAYLLLKNVLNVESLIFFIFYTGTIASLITEGNKSCEPSMKIWMYVMSAYITFKFILRNCDLMCRRLDGPEAYLQIFFKKVIEVTIK